MSMFSTFMKKSPDDLPLAVSGIGDGAPARRRGPVVGIALGGGAARGWAHIGIMRELMAQGIRPDIVAGTSAGAVVGGCYAAGKLDELEEFTRSLTRSRILALMDMSFRGGGLIGGSRLKNRLDTVLADTQIEDLPIKFAAVATEVGAGHEVWLTQGRLADAVRASYALPGIFEPVRFRGRWLFDGALVNPVPVSVCRALGAQVVIAVNLSSENYGRGGVKLDPPDLSDAGAEKQIEDTVKDAPESAQASWFFRRQVAKTGEAAPGIGTIMVDAFNITQDRIARSRLAGDPPDVMINARAGKFGLFEFHRAGEMIDIGRAAVRRALEEIQVQIRMEA